MTDKPKFDKPIGQWIDEEVKVTSMRPVVSDYGGKTRVDFKAVETIENQKSIYIESKERQIGCAKDKHDWFMTDKNTYLVKCHFCELRRRISPLHHDIRDGKIIHLATGQEE